MQSLKKIVLVCLSFILAISVVLPMNPATSEAASTKATKITDMSPTNSKYKAAKWVTDNDYMQLDKGKFQAGTLVMEWQMLQMLAKLDKNYHLESYEKEVLYAYYGELNLPLYGVTNDKKRVANISRGHFARIYAAMNGLDLSEVQAIQYLYMNEITTGTTGKRTYEDYLPNRNIARGDMAVFMHRIYQKGSIAVEGLTANATGKDNNKITLPTNFVASKSDTTEVPNLPGKSTNDKEDRPDVYKAIKSINVASEELIANGVDSSLVSVEIRDSYGNEVPYDQSLAFKVTSDQGATISDTNTSTSEKTTTVYTDGPDLDFFVIAPALTKSANDIIRLEMINPPKGFETYKNQVIEVKVRYVPKPELRITYEVFDPENTAWSGGNVDPGPKPLPALPQGVPVVNGGNAGMIATKDVIRASTVRAVNNVSYTLDYSITVPFKEKGLITIEEYDEDTKLMTGTKWEPYTSSNGSLTQGTVYSDEIQYGNAELKLEGQVISVWLFEQILEYMIRGFDDGSSWGGLGTAKVMYTVNSEGRATYDLQGAISEELTNQFESMIHPVVIYLIELLPVVDQITLAHEESVKVIYALYNRLSKIDQEILLKANSQLIGKLTGAVNKIETLEKGAELAQRPEGMERYTKVIVNLVLPSGVVVTDYKGSVEVSFNGKSKTVSFNTNTKDYNKGTGYAGSAVAYFDDVVYGVSNVTAKLVEKDSRYDKALQGINTLTATEKIYANPRFEQNMCGNLAEIGFAVDHSKSMKVADPKNIVAELTKQAVRQLQGDPTHVYRFSTSAKFEAKDKATPVASREDLLDYNRSDAPGTNIIDSVTTVINALESNEYTNKTIVLITDGKTSSSKVTRLIELAKQKNVAIHTIAYGKYTAKAEEILKNIADGTGGTFRVVKDLAYLHSAIQAVITSIECNTIVADKSCYSGLSLFTSVDVVIEREDRVHFIANINTGCNNVEAVKTVFYTDKGETSYDLRKRNSHRFMERPYLYEMPGFDYYTDVEFEAYDKSGDFIGSILYDMNTKTMKES